MTSPRATIVDYGMGNIRSLAKALERAGASVEVRADPAGIAAADRVVIPGQGAFGQAMTRLEATGQREALVRAFEAGRPMLGICLGLQVLFEGSEEAPGVDGFGLLEGQVTLLPVGDGLVRPHMGWADVHHDGDHPVFSANPSGEPFYFVHSYAAHHPDGAFDHATIARCTHGVDFVAAAARDGLVATQFHPEKSQAAGHRLLSAWLGL